MAMLMHAPIHINIIVLGHTPNGKSTTETYTDVHSTQHATAAARSSQMNGADSQTKRCGGIAESGGRCPAQTHRVQGEWVAEAEKPGKGRRSRGRALQGQLGWRLLGRMELLPSRR